MCAGKARRRNSSSWSVRVCVSIFLRESAKKMRIASSSIRRLRSTNTRRDCAETLREGTVLMAANVLSPTERRS